MVPDESVGDVHDWISGLVEPGLAAEVVPS
jgi:hypothetical protein